MPLTKDAKPKFMPWNDDEFWSSPRVRKMQSIERQFFRTLLQASWYCDTRPYLPADDNELWVLADADSLEQWQAHKEPVLAMFYELVADGAGPMLANKRVLRDWNNLADIRGGMSELGKKRAANAQRTASGMFSVASAPPANHQRAASEPPAREVKVSKVKGSEVNTPPAQKLIESSPAIPCNGQDLAPEGLGPAGLARGLLERIGLPLVAKNHIAAEAAIIGVMKDKSWKDNQACDWLEMRARSDMARGVEVKCFWFEDAKYNHTEARASPPPFDGRLRRVRLPEEAR